MSFLNPTLALIALGCVAAPVVIHLLFRRRTRPLEWGAMRFVLEAFRRQRKRMRLEQLLILAARTLAVLVLALAVGRPMFSGQAVLQSRTPRDLVLIVDNSLTSQARAGEGTELETNKREALRLLDSLDAGRGDRAAVVTLGGPAEKVAAPLTTELAGVRRAVEAIEATDSAADVAGGLSAARDLVGRDGSRQSSLAFLSGLRRGSLDAAKPVEAAESTLRPDLLLPEPAAEGLDNAAVVSVEPLRSVLLREAGAPETQQARVTVTRHGPGVSAAATINLRVAAVTIGESEAPAWATTPVRFAAGQETASVLAPIGFAKSDKAATGPLWIEARVDEDAIGSDNVFRKPWKSRETVRVVVAAPATDSLSGSPMSYSAADWITLALSPRTGGVTGALESENEPITIGRADPTRLSAADLLGVDCVFVTRPDMLPGDGWSTLAEFARKGGLVVVTAPTASGIVQEWAEGLGKSIGLGLTAARETASAAPARAIRAGVTESRDLGALLSGLSAEMEELAKPVVVARWVASEVRGEAARLLTLEDGTALLVAARPENASRGLVVVLMTAPELESTSLPAMPLMVPLFQEIVRQGVGLASGSSTSVAGASVSEASELRRVTPTGGAAMGEAARGASLWRRVDGRGVTRELVAINADGTGSATDVQGREQVGAFLKAAAQAGSVTFLKPTADGSTGAREALPSPSRTPPIDLPLLVAGLVLLVLDAFLSRWFSHATVGGRVGVVGRVTGGAGGTGGAGSVGQRGAAA